MVRSTSKFCIDIKERIGNKTSNNSNKPDSILRCIKIREKKNKFRANFVIKISNNQALAKKL